MNILEKVEDFYNNFHGEKGIIGKSVNGKPIYYFAVEKTNSPKVIVQCAIHAREYITSYLALKLADDFIKNGKFGKVYFIPIMNPDGVEISLKSQPLYKANFRGVDLNVNFDARWGTGRTNAFYPKSQNYVGARPFSEPETQALANFTVKVKPSLTISYHSKGEEIYWEFFQTKENLVRDGIIAEKTASITGYTLASAPRSAGGYKDWCIEKLKIPALTIEVGEDTLTHPIIEKHCQEIYNKNKGLLTALIEIL